MSKASLKKALKELDNDQLQELILEVYEALKPAKEYFEFFLNPNVEKLTEKYQKTIAKELGRVKRRESKARVSVIKKAVKEYSAFGVDKRDVNNLRLWIIHQMLITFYHNYHTETQVNALKCFVQETMIDADQGGFYSEQLEKLLNVVDNTKCWIGYINMIRRLVGQPIIEKKE